MLQNGTSLRERKWISVDTSEYMTTLSIKRVKPEDAGEYSLVAKSRFGSQDVTFVLRVKGAYVGFSRADTGFQERGGAY